MIENILGSGDSEFLLPQLSEENISIVIMPRESIPAFEVDPCL
jgi:hypothetical protein